MRIADLCFLALVAGTVCALMGCCVAVGLRKWRFTKRCGAVVLGAWLLFLAVGAIVALVTPQRFLRPGEARCFDEMCFQVTHAQRCASLDTGKGRIVPKGVFYTVMIQVTNRSLGRSQREGGAVAWLLDANGRKHMPGVAGAVVPEGCLGALDMTLSPGQSAVAWLVFDVPEAVHRPGVVLGHDYFFNPAVIIPGDEQHFLQRPPVTLAPE